MWLWWVCVKSMEKHVERVTFFTNYQNRQVILNYYDQDDMLFQRDGFHFESIQVTDDCLCFSKNDSSDFTINLNIYPQKYINTDLLNYYIFRNNTGRQVTGSVTYRKH
jgi:hypothetical protein